RARLRHRLVPQRVVAIRGTRARVEELALAAALLAQLALAALRAGHAQRVRLRELAVGPSLAGGVAPVGGLLRHEAGAAQRARALDRHGQLGLVQRLRVLALRVTRAREERAVAAELLHEVVLAARGTQDVRLLLEFPLDLAGLPLQSLEVLGERRP